LKQKPPLALVSQDGRTVVTLVEAEDAASSFSCSGPGTRPAGERPLEQCTMYLTRDARDWTPINSEFPPDQEQWVSEGPAGILAGTESGAVYRLVP
jgi:hypothetical protein